MLGGTSSSWAGADKTTTNGGYWVIKLTPGTLSSPLSEESFQELSVYPNPSKRDFHVALPDIKPGTEPLELVLYNALGQQVLRQQVKPTELQAGVVLPAATLGRGAYYVQLQVQGKVFTKKVILN
ncbi:T9SS type A sorting domain-containing protein [Pontibacter beigongshangensis]|uniref:T9SS type A sorting domain-containing protein n=1 Tax=Pontibacter beigongshangensis TaxID=2574733 RepID=UPI00164F3BB9|nr:T9SS type A sorting domain-containing protein [Pontibacter beigongshangensis]